MNAIGTAVNPKIDWRYSRWWKNCLIFGYIIIAFLPVLAGFIFAPPENQGFFKILGRATGLIGFSILVLQFVLSARFKFLDRAFGLDKLMSFHKWMAIIGGILILLHPAFLALNTKNFFLFTMQTPWRVNLGKGALLIIIVTVLFSLLLKKLKFQYQVWRFLHKSVIIILLLGFLHGLFTGTSMKIDGMKLFWWMLFVITFIIYVYRNLYMPLWGRKRFTVTAVEHATYDTYTLLLKPDDNVTLPHHPGQFMFLKLKRPGRKSEQHPFTIASSPTGEMPLQATIKKSGDFTNTIGETVPGDKAFIEAPFGRFSFVHDNPKSFLFIAGGVGITPIMSMLRYLRDTADKRRAILIYGNKSEKDIVFKDELEKMSAWLNTVHVLMNPAKEWTGARGFVTKELLQKEAGGILTEADIYLCGPPIMMKKVKEALKSLGVSKKRIHYELFSL